MRRNESILIPSRIFSKPCLGQDCLGSSLPSLVGFSRPGGNRADRRESMPLRSTACFLACRDCLLLQKQCRSVCICLPEHSHRGSHQASEGLGKVLISCLECCSLSRCLCKSRMWMHTTQQSSHQKRLNFRMALAHCRCH